MLKAPPLTHAVVRDLAWLINSPPIIQETIDHTHWTNSTFWLQQYQEIKDLIYQLDANPSELQSTLEQQQDKRLGHRFETLLSFFFKLNKRYDVLAHNLQIQDKKRTIGEFDFIVQDTLLNKTQHWEVACKFYLGIGDTLQYSNWHGPMLRDRLDIKFSQMQTKQSLLSNHTCATHQLNTLGIHIDQRICLLKGRLFHPISNDHQYSPPHVSKDHQTGWWARASEFNKNSSLGNMKWAVLNKNQWFAPLEFNAATNTYCRDELLDIFLAKSGPRPICIAGFSQQPNSTIETTRGFLVANDWATELTSNH